MEAWYDYFKIILRKLGDISERGTNYLKENSQVKIAIKLKALGDCG